MRRLVAIALLVLLPLQFSWAAVATYCGHEPQPGAAHFGHHDHEHHAHADADANADTGLAADLGAGPPSAPDTAGGAEDMKAPGAMDLDCGHCHGTCSVILTLPPALPGALSTACPSTAVHEMGAVHAPTRPERPQWLPLA